MKRLTQIFQALLGVVTLMQDALRGVRFALDGRNVQNGFAVRLRLFSF